MGEFTLNIQAADDSRAIQSSTTIKSRLLTNGTITSFSRPMSAAGEIEETMTIKFRGNGDMHNFSKYAISADWDMTGL